jgi:hypothetical protein
MKHTKFLNITILAALMMVAAATSVKAELDVSGIVNQFNSLNANAQNPDGKGAYLRFQFNYDDPLNQLDHLIRANSTGKPGSGDVDTIGPLDYYEGNANPGAVGYGTYNQGFWFYTFDVRSNNRLSSTQWCKLNYDAATGKTYAMPIADEYLFGNQPVPQALTVGAAFLYKWFATQTPLPLTGSWGWEELNRAFGHLMYGSFNNPYEHTLSNNQYVTALLTMLNRDYDGDFDLAYLLQDYSIHTDYAFMGDYAVFVLNASNYDYAEKGLITNNYLFLGSGVRTGDGNDDPCPCCPGCTQGSGCGCTQCGCCGSGDPGDPGNGDVPEPATMLLWALGGLGFAGTSWARKRRLKQLA